MDEIAALQAEIAEKTARLNELRKQAAPIAVRNYTLQNLEGEVTLLDLFAGRETLFAIHNMGQGCRYCTLWADGLNGFVPHLESVAALVLLSRDPPETQRAFAASRGWKFRMASHGGGEYAQEQVSSDGDHNSPGLVCYQRKGDRIFKAASAEFGPGDVYCPIWHFLGLAGLGLEDWTPQFAYWKRPQKMDDGGLNILD